MRENVIGPVINRLPDGNWYKSLTHQAKWLHELSFLDGGARYARSLSYFYFSQERRYELYSAQTRQQLELADPERDIRDYYDAPQSIGPVDRMLYADYQSRLPDHPVLISDRMSMAASRRSPPSIPF